MSRRNKDIIELLLQHGADVNSIDFGEVVYVSDPTIIRLFIDRGADVLTGYPIARGLIHATRLFLGIYKSYIGKYPQLQFQADMAWASSQLVKTACFYMPQQRFGHWPHSDSEYRARVMSLLEFRAGGKAMRDITSASSRNLDRQFGLAVYSSAQVRILTGGSTLGLLNERS